MRDSFDQALRAVLAHEGGFVDDPKDPGGATNHGVTQTVYDDWRAGHHLPRQSVKQIVTVEIMAIYKSRYWDAVRCDDLPAGVDYCVFDFAVNSGVNRAARYLQRAAGMVMDGQVGPETLAAVKLIPPPIVIDNICNGRLSFLQSLGTFGHFGKGWTRRVEDVRVKAKAMT